MKAFFNKLKLKHIDVFVYKMPSQGLVDFVIDISSYTLKNETQNGRQVFCILDSFKKTIHKSFIFKKVYLLKLIQVQGDVIGGCSTSEKHRGKGFYPFMLNTIGKTYAKDGNFDLYIIVDKSNTSSIRGIEKAGFIKYKSVKTKRFGPIYFDTMVE
ncbi:hypothetical protein DI383_02300 [Flavobacteriaceae bacterium LYZ1037]|nr:hypothetical protein DI383_02300 [Flavobacteriaceae bacterium LYZ1037]